MKLYFPTRDQARAYQKSDSKTLSRKLVDCKDKPHKNGWRWAVQHTTK